jgi:hypothetical protein
MFGVVNPDEELQRQAAPRQQRGNAPQHRRLGEYRTVERFCAGGQRLERLPVRGDLIVGQPRRARDRRKPIVGRQGHAKEPAVEIVGREQRLPDNSTQKGEADQPPARAPQNLERLSLTPECQGDRQTPVGQQIDMVVSERPVVDDPRANQDR